MFAAVLALLVFAAGATAGRGLAALIRVLAREGGFASSRYYSLARGFAASLPAIGHWFAPRGTRCPRLALLEFAAGFAALACWELFPPFKALCGAVFLFALLGAFFIDLDHMIIPDLFTIGLAIAGLLLSAACPSLHGCGAFTAWNALRSLAASMLGLAIGSATVLWFGLIGEAIWQREVLGFGDVKFLGAIGAFCGWQGALFALFGGAVIGLLAMIVRGAGAMASGRRLSALLATAASRREIGRMGASQPFPFGPMLAAAAAAYFLAFHSGVDAFFAPYRLLF